MFRRGIVLIGILLLFVGSTSAQDATWIAWLYNAEQGRATQVSATGEVIADVELAVPSEFIDGSATFASGLAVSGDGTRFAYRITGTDFTGAPLTNVVLFDVATSEITTQYQPPISPNADIFDLFAAPRIFSENGGTIAYSFATGDDEATQAWYIVILDAFGGTQLYDLTSRDEAIITQGFESTTAPFLLPAIQDYEGANLHFSLVPYLGGGFLQNYDSFRWNVISGRVNFTQRYPTTSGDLLPTTQENITPIYDERVAVDENSLPYQNALHVYRPELGGRVPFYASTTVDLISTAFVQNGEYIAAYGQSLSDFSPLWLLINRAGTAERLPDINALNNRLVGTPDGFIYTLDAASPVVVRADTTGETVEQVALWTSNDGTGYVPVWVSPPTPSDFSTDWAQLAPPLFAAQTVIVQEDTSNVGQGGGIEASSVTPFAPNPRGSLLVNGVAITNTTGGDRLNMRDDPSLSSNIIARIEDGSRVVLLDGPIAADGFVWWQVRLSTGLVGWMVQSADGVDTLIPIG